MTRSELIGSTLDAAWHRQTAEASIERWLQVCEQQQWGDIPENIEQLILVFGASWYFTRFIFFRGKKSAELIDKPLLTSFDAQTLLQFLSTALEGEDQENQFEWLRSLKNQAMLQILLRRLTEQESLSDNEAALTNLSIATLNVAMNIVGLDLDNLDGQIAVLGMGRIAGLEMNYGSDLDLIFLYRESSENFHSFFSDKIRKLLRNMSLLTPTGVLYDIDMRLRPHGTSGALITSEKSFLEYHQGKREIWERQMMTRCQAVIDKQGLGENSLQQVRPYIYTTSFDQSATTEILSVRQRVEDELGSRRGKIDVKRGKGGIMDIDFITHYLQLQHACDSPELQTSSTREALSILAELNLLKQDDANNLLHAYDFFKQIEACLRLFDMKSVNSFSRTLDDGNALVRAMSYKGEGAAARFLDKHKELTENTHNLFLSTLT
ncbi:MAG: hypothetical protein HN764_17110 [Gammaproteobacteria bacterium]|jgi:[glutamine synthetase] adenylyltransferase / [glutamine synthetase]-adenylyl-L-tyrosine phosphorylase|nr:hypothetical protein [Gammaproteobacteria bacterium]